MTRAGKLMWRKSSYSSNNGGDCIEIADGLPHHTPVRDSKDPQGPALLFPSPSFAAFITAVKAGDFDATTR